MRVIQRLIALLLLLFIIVNAINAQDSTGAVKDWKIESKKIGDGKYELTFTGNVFGNWQVYAPNQVLLDVKTTELQFADSNIVHDGDFVLVNEVKEINSNIFEMKVKVQEKAVQWKATININGVVPETLQGTLFYTYGKEDEFYPSTTVPRNA
jgi:thiol:disulfide interchange protein DsbD